MVWLLTLTLLGLGLMALLPQAVFPVELASNLRPQIGAACLLLAAASLGLGRLGVALALTAVAVLVFAAAPELFQRAGPRLNGPALTVVWSNAFKDPRAVARLARWASAQDAEVIVIAEPPRDKAALLQALSRWPYRFGDETDRHGVIVFSRLPLRDTNLSGGARGERYPTTSVTVDAPGGPLRLIGLHTPVSASPSRLRTRDAQILRAAQDAEAAGRALMVGDMNATPWSSGLRAVRRRTRLQRLSAGMASTWFSPWPILGLPIDHALTTPGVRGAVRVGPPIGSDHLPLLIRVS